MKKSRILIIFLSLGLLLAKAPLISVVTDTDTYREAGTAIDAYCKALEDQGYEVKRHVREWKNPEALREQLRLDMAGGQLEGSVFIGDIPIPMILDAQHLTSAFKIDQDRFDDLRRIAVASDRFYDDPDLIFDFIRQDEDNPLLFYYSLSEASPQYIEKDFYSGRIFPPVHDERKYRMINDYLLRVAAMKSDPELPDTFMTFTGHGYHSESLNAWENHSLMLQEQFPDLYRPGGSVKHYYHTMSRNMKEILMREMQKPGLDMAIFHAHGGYDAQYLMGYPPAANARENVEEIKRFVRSKLRSAKRRGNYEEAKAYYLENYDIPEHWIEDTFDEESIEADSLYNAALDIYTPDVRTIKAEADIIMFDQCYNGQFFKEDYISGAYVFGDGTVAAGIANTVNVRQDIWANELLGLLRFGVPLGEWHMSRNYLESHIIGDPTYRFAPLSRARLNSPWRRLLRSDDTTLRTLGVYRLYHERGAAAEEKLLQLYHEDPSANVRLQALKSLAALRTESFRELLKVSITDPSELIRRFSVNWMGKVGKPEYFPYLADHYFYDISDRVSFSAKGEMDQIFPDPGTDTYYRAYIAQPGLDSASIRRLEYSYKRNHEWLFDDIIGTLKNKEETPRKRITRLRTFRNYNFVPGISELLNVAKDDSDDTAVRVACIEALGWYTLYDDYPAIIEALQSLKSCPDEAVRKETLKSIRRLEAGPNVVITP
jgi:hypothetical protein